MTQLKDKACAAISDYLQSCGWIQEYISTDETFFYLRDPLTQALHRSDMAWFIQTEREAYDVIKKQEPPKTPQPTQQDSAIPAQSGAATANPDATTGINWPLINSMMATPDKASDEVGETYAQSTTAMISQQQVELLNALKEAWSANPELRLCQLIQNAAYQNDWRDCDLFHLPDADLHQSLKEYVK